MLVQECITQRGPFVPQLEAVLQIKIQEEVVPEVEDVLEYESVGTPSVESAAVSADDSGVEVSEVFDVDSCELPCFSVQNVPYFPDPNSLERQEYYFLDGVRVERDVRKNAKFNLVQRKKCKDFIMRVKREDVWVSEILLKTTMK